MNDHVAVHPATEASPLPRPTEGPAEDVVITDLLIEEVSIDGMCGVY